MFVDYKSQHGNIKVHARYTSGLHAEPSSQSKSILWQQSAN